MTGAASWAGPVAVAISVSDALGNVWTLDGDVSLD